MFGVKWKILLEWKHIIPTSVWENNSNSKNVNDCKSSGNVNFIIFLFSF